MMLPTFDGPVPDFAAPFWDAITEGRIVLPRCDVCGRWQWYPEPGGTDCPGGSLRWVDVAVTGAIYAYTTVHRSFLPGGRDHVPYLVGMIDLDDIDADANGGRPRLIANLTDDATIGWHVGTRVRATFPTIGTRTHLVFEPEVSDT